MANNVIRDFKDAGSDAFSNMYDLEFIFPYLEKPQILTIRTDGVKLPSAKPKTYTLKYHGMPYTRVAPELEIDRKLTLTFRVDVNFYLYEVLKTLAHEHGNITTGGVANTYGEAGIINAYFLQGEYTAPITPGIEGHEGTSMADQLLTKSGTFSSNMYGGKNNTLCWSMQDTYLLSVSEPEGKRESADPLTVQAEFIVNDPRYPQGVGNDPSKAFA